MYHINEDVKKKVYETFGRNEQMVEDDVRIIKTWIKTQPHLPEIMEDVKIKNFLNLNKFSIEKTKQKIDMYYTIRSVIPEVFEVSNPRLANTENIFNTSYMFTFPKPLNDIHRVYFSKLKKPNTFIPIDWCNVWLAIFEIRLYEDFVVDDYAIIDLENYTLGDIKKMTPTLLSKFMVVYEKVYALRIKKIIYLNCSPFISILAMILKPVLKPKIFNRVEFHQDAEVLKKIFPNDQLPKDYGGDGPSLDELSDMMKKKFAQYQDRFDQLDKLKVDENLRPEKLNNDEILGYYGSFKRIEVD